MHWRRKWQPTPVFLPGESQGRGSLVGCHLWGRTELDTTEATSQQQQHTYLCGCVFLLGIQGMEGPMWARIVRFHKDSEAPATAAKSLQSCSTLCNPIDGSPPGSPVPGIVQARTLEWVAISFSNDQPRQHIKKHRHYFANKGPTSQSFGSSNSPVWM